MTDGDDEPLAGVDSETVSPDAVDPDEVRAALSHSDRLVRQRGARVCAMLAAEEAEHVRPFVDDLGPLLEDESLVAAQQAANALIPVSDDHPADLADHLDAVVSFVRTDLGGDRSRGATIVANVVVERPDLVAPHASDLLEVVRETESGMEVADDELPDDEQTRRTIRQHEATEAQARVVSRASLANAVVAVAESHPEALAEDVDDLLALLDDDGVVGPALDALGELADAGVAIDDLDPVLECLEHDDTGVRARAIRTLGLAGAEEAVPALRRVARDDENDEVRDLAADTADFLESNA